MRCPSCDHDNRAERRFCAECGAPLAAICASCGVSNQPGEKFCGGCGVALTPGLPAAPTRSPATATPKHLAAKILRSKSALEGERKQVTVLFADVTRRCGVLRQGARRRPVGIGRRTAATAC